MGEAEVLLKAAHEKSEYTSAYDTTYNNVMKLIKGYTTEDFASLRSLADELEQLNGALFGEAVVKLRNAADSLEDYEAYK